MKRTTCILFLLLASNACLAAAKASAPPAKDDERFNRHNLSFYGLGGVSTLLYNTTWSEGPDLGFGGGGGIGYGVNFIPQFGIYFGAEAMTLQCNFAAATLIDEESTFENRNVFYRTIKLKAQQTALMLNVPFMLQAQFDVSDNWQFYVAAGAKFGMAFFEDSYTSIKGQTYVINDGSEPVVSPTLDFDYDLREKIKFNYNLALSAEAGMRRKLTSALYLYVGAYADYGIFEIRQAGSEKRLTIESQNSQGVEGTNNFFKTNYINSKVNTFGFGLKIKFDIDLGDLHARGVERRAKRREERAQQRAKREEAKKHPPDHDSRLVVSVRNAMSQGILPATIMISNKAKVKGEDMDSIVTEVDKNIYRVRMKEKGDYVASVNVELPADLRRALAAPDDSSASAGSVQADDEASAKGSGRIKIMVRDAQSGAAIRGTTLKLLDSKTLLFVDVLARPTADGGYWINLPAEFNGYLTFHVGGRTIASFQRGLYEEDEEKSVKNAQKTSKQPAQRITGAKNTAITTKRTAAARSAGNSPVEVRRIITPIVSGDAAVGAPTSSVGRLVEYLNRTFGDYTLRVRRLFIGGQARQQIEIQAVQ